MNLSSHWNKKLFLPLLAVFSFFLINNISYAQLLSTEFSLEMLAKASPDEDYFGLGDPNNNYNPFLASFSGTPKVNQAYVWGLAKNGDQLWFGTAPNVHCLVVGGYLGVDLPHETDCWSCEFGESQLSPPVPSIIGDWRPSRIFMYDLGTKVLVEKTPFSSSLLNSTLGLRSAGAIGDIVFLGGPSMTSAGIVLFAFNASTGEMIGEQLIPNLPDGSVPGNIRKWLVVNNELYFGVGVGNLLSEDVEGRILKWTGDLTNPFQFEIVGNIKGDAAELAMHEGRMFVSTWGGPTGIWMGPVVPESGGLTNADADNWEKVWGIEEYEVDLITLNTTGGGALASYGGYLFWGTMHVPMMSAALHMNYFAPDSPVDVAAAVFGTYRAISIFRGKDFGEPEQEVDLLYGHEHLPSYNPFTGWSIKENNMPVKKPLFGLSGFGNLMNNYTWTMQVYNDKLFVGTMDWSILVAGIVSELIDVALPDPDITSLDELIPDNFYNSVQDMSGVPYFSNVEVDLSSVDLSILENTRQIASAAEGIVPPLSFGADLWYFDSPETPAKPLSVNGVGNNMSYGIRTMLSTSDDLFLGMANPMNLNERGGWELLQINSTGKGVPDLISDVNHENVPLEFKLANNYPNPFNPSTKIKFSLPQESDVVLEIHNSLGQVVATLVNGRLNSGFHEVQWNAENMSSGVYFYKIKTDHNSAIQKMILMK